MRRAHQPTASATRSGVDDTAATRDRTATPSETGPAEPGALFVAFELGWTTWKLAFAARGERGTRRRTIRARDLAALAEELRRAKRRFNLPEEAPVRTCYEAGRDGFWLHRCLTAQGIENVVVDSASIEVNRRARRAKSDKLDAGKLLSMLMRRHGGEMGVWSVVNVPGVEAEDRRQRQRELQTLRRERTEHVNRIRGLLAAQGVDVKVNRSLRGRLDELRQWDERPLPPHLRDRVERELARIELLDQQIRTVEQQRCDDQRRGEDRWAHLVRQLCALRGIGPESAWLMVSELFGWRGIRNRKQLAALAGLTPTPYDSGQTQRDQGISKAGNRRVRWMLIQIAWGWLRHQPASELARWYEHRFGSGGKRQRRIGIVALARKLLVKLWRYLETGAPPEGAALTA